MERFHLNGYIVEYYYKPSENNYELKDAVNFIGSKCFETIPNYQCFKSFENKVIVLLKNSENLPLAFASGILLNIKEVGTVLHSGLVSILPEHRNKGFLMMIYYVLVGRTLAKLAENQKIYLTNLSCDLGILRFFGKFVDSVYPSPDFKGRIGELPLYIANQINENFREEMYILKDAIFNPHTFVFSGSIKDTVFSKNVLTNKHSRDTEFYLNLLDYDNGDELLQIGFLDQQLFEERKKILQRFGNIDVPILV